MEAFKSFFYEKIFLLQKATRWINVLRSGKNQTRPVVVVIQMMTILKIHFMITLLSRIRWMIPYRNFWKYSPDLQRIGEGSCKDVSTKPCEQYGTPAKVGRVFESRIFVNWKNKLRRTMLRKRQDQRFN